MIEEKGATTPATGAAPDATAVPKGLEKFSSEGKLDAAKLGEGYLNLEKQSTQTSQKLAEIERTMAMMSAGMYGGGTGDTGRGADQGRSEEEDTVPLTRAEARPVVQGFLELAHPEIAFDHEKGKFKDETFMAELQTFTRSLPVTVKQAIAAGDFTMTDWAIKQFKALKGKAASGAAQAGGGSSVKPNFAEGASPGVQQGGKTYSRSDMRKLMTDNPAEYARIADSELGKAYEEGRVKE